MNIRTQLRGLILVTLLPLAVLGAAGVYLLVDRERESFERGMVERTRALVTAIDAELSASMTPLELLARSPTLDTDDLLGFRADAQRALEARRDVWSNIVLSHPESADMLLNMLVPAGQPLFKTLDPASVVATARAGRPTVGVVVQGGVLKRPLFTVRVPVLREGKVKYVLSAVIETTKIARIVEGLQLPESYAVAVVDGNYTFVARKPPPEKAMAVASGSLREALASARMGFVRGKLQDGSEIYRAFQHSSLSNWSVSIAAPREVVEQRLRGVWLAIAGFVAAAVLGLSIAWYLASRISRPIAALAAAAPRLGHGDVSALPPPSGIDEVRGLSSALGEAAAAISEREERQRLAEQALRSADRAKDEFLAMLGHELRNPLASVSNAAQLLKLAPREPAVIDNVSDILSRQIEHMTRLVDDLLEVGRVTGGKVRLERAALDLAAAAGETVETWRSGGRFLHHELRTHFEPVWVNADRARMQQVISNLLDNALKYTPSGGKITLTVRQQDEKAIVQVQDTGEGMTPELIDRVFDLFVQGERSLARQPGGLGIGLTMAKRLVEQHDGTIVATSEGPSRGATFTVTLPAIEKPADNTVPPSAAAAAKGYRILIIEDNEDAGETLATLLRMNGHEVAVARNGTDGVALARTMAPEVVLVDIGLPDIEGYEVARRLKSDPATNQSRLIALTGYGMPEDRRRAIAAGFDDHLVKPVDLEALQALL